MFCLSATVSFALAFTKKIVRPGSLDTGILLSKAEDTSGRDSPSSNSSSTHWLVSVEGNSKEEDVSERYLGRVLPKEADGDSNGSNGRRSPKSGSAVVRKPATRKDSRVTNNTDDEAKASSDNNSGGKLRATKAAARGKPAAKTAYKAKASAQAAKAALAPRKYATRRGKGEGEELYEGIDKITSKKPKPRVPAPKPGPDETVIKVKMLTGTLYLYRGLRPRAEFVRIV